MPCFYDAVIFTIKPIKPEIDLFMRHASDSFTKSYCSAFIESLNSVGYEQETTLFFFQTTSFKESVNCGEEVGDHRTILLVNERRRTSHHSLSSSDCGLL